MQFPLYIDYIDLIYGRLKLNAESFKTKILN